jgi:CRISPR-associated protein Cmr3
MTKAFTHLLQITPLGLLYGSAGGFLSPENLVGRSGNKFPPSSATVSGLYAQVHSNPEQTEGKTWLLPDLCLAGPFWAKQHNLQNFYVPTPLIYSVEQNTTKIKYKLSLKSLRSESQSAHWQSDPIDPNQSKQTQPEKFKTDTWLAISDWNEVTAQTEVYSSPWKYLPHLHPRLQEEQRHTKEGDLFLENAVQVDPDVSLIYLTNEVLPDGWYRFGGEGHLVDIKCCQLTDQKIIELLNDKVRKTFALITPAVWGSNRFSYRFPQLPGSNPSVIHPNWEYDALITERPQTFRYRLGGKLSRGRYAMPAGSVYVLKKALKKPWHDWPENWFPTEAYSFKRWGCGLALPLSI